MIDGGSFLIGLVVGWIIGLGTGYSYMENKKQVHLMEDKRNE